IATYDEHTPEQVEAALDRAMSAFETLRAQSFQTRAGWMRVAANYLRSNQHELAEMATREMGKPIVEAEAEIAKCAWVCDYYADNAESHLSPIARESDATESYIAFEPIGPVLAIMPWNFPFWQ